MRAAAQGPLARWQPFSAVYRVPTSVRGCRSAFPGRERGHPSLPGVGSPIAAVPKAGGYGALPAARLVDTRVTGVRLARGARLIVPALGRQGVPASGVGAVQLHVTAVGASAASHLTVHPNGSAPTTSSLNYQASRAVANTVTTTAGTGGAVVVTNGNASVDVVVDLVGWVAARPGPALARPARGRAPSRLGQPGRRPAGRPPVARRSLWRAARCRPPPGQSSSTSRPSTRAPAGYPCCPGPPAPHGPRPRTATPSRARRWPPRSSSGSAPGAASHSPWVAAAVTSSRRGRLRRHVTDAVLGHQRRGAHHRPAAARRHPHHRHPARIRPAPRPAGHRSGRSAHVGERGPGHHHLRPRRHVHRHPGRHGQRRAPSLRRPT